MVFSFAKKEKGFMDSPGFSRHVVFFGHAWPFFYKRKAWQSNPESPPRQGGVLPFYYEPINRTIWKEEVFIALRRCFIPVKGQHRALEKLVNYIGKIKLH